MRIASLNSYVVRNGEFKVVRRSSFVVTRSQGTCDKDQEDEVENTCTDSGLREPKQPSRTSFTKVFGGLYGIDT